MKELRGGLTEQDLIAIADSMATQITQPMKKKEIDFWQSSSCRYGYYFFSTKRIKLLPWERDVLAVFIKRLLEHYYTVGTNALGLDFDWDAELEKINSFMSVNVPGRELGTRPSLRALCHSIYTNLYDF